MSTSFFFFNDTATTEIYTLSLHDALPIYRQVRQGRADREGIQLRQRHRLPKREQPLCRRNRQSEGSEGVVALEGIVRRVGKVARGRCAMSSVAAGDFAHPTTLAWKEPNRAAYA